jgi:deoxyribodipyrimidine photo-lyase
MKAPVIHWFRRDLRLEDNLALHAAIRSGSPVIPLFILDDHLLQSRYVGAARLNFLYTGLRSLDASLRQIGSRLIVRRGDPHTILHRLIAQLGVTDLYLNRDYSPYALQRDASIIRELPIAAHQYHDAILLPPGSVTKADGSPYVVYTPFWKNWQKQVKPAVSTHHYTTGDFLDLTELASQPIPDSHSEPILASESTAHHLLEAFLQSDIFHYSERRNWLPINPFSASRPEGTSYLSPFLRLGLLSPRQVYWAARSAYASTRSPAYQESIEKWVAELAWREFFIHIMHYFPHVLRRDFVDTYQSLAWRHAPDELEAWQQGMTGFPVIDAPMRQLNALGWMPNRARMIVASFLTKDLLIHWKEGETYFMQQLIDGDPAANNGGWQWAAGTGTDAQPYFRIFNPVSQSEKFATPQYLRHWIPELSNVPDESIHEPWTVPALCRAYPEPIVDHAFARERTLQAFKQARGE